MPQADGRFKPNTPAYARPATLGAGVTGVFGFPAGPRHLFKQQPGPGANAYALLPTIPQMAYSLPGAGYVVENNGASHVLSGPQVTWAQSQVVTGMNGQVFAGAYQQGLIDYQAYILAQG